MCHSSCPSKSPTCTACRIGKKYEACRKTSTLIFADPSLSLKKNTYGTGLSPSLPCNKPITSHHKNQNLRPTKHGHLRPSSQWHNESSKTRHRAANAPARKLEPPREPREPRRSSAARESRLGMNGRWRSHQGVPDKGALAGSKPGFPRTSNTP